MTSLRACDNGPLWRKIFRLPAILVAELAEILESSACHFPGRTGRGLRRVIFGRRFRQVGARPMLAEGIQVLGPENITIGNDFWASRGCFLGALHDGTIQIGDDVSFATNVTIDAGMGGIIRIGDKSGIAHNCVLRAATHLFQDPSKPFKLQGHKPGSIIIEEDVWVSANSVVLAGSHLQKGTIVGAGSVVSGTFKPYSIVAGNPARVIGRRGA